MISNFMSPEEHVSYEDSIDKAVAKIKELHKL